MALILTHMGFSRSSDTTMYEILHIFTGIKIIDVVNPHPPRQQSISRRQGFSPSQRSR